MDRQVKGVDVRSTVAALRSVRKSTTLPPMGERACELLEHRILPSSWYPFEPFLELTGVLHRVVFQSSDEGAAEMGRLVAQQSLGSVHAAFVSHHEIGRVLQSLSLLWRAHYNFGDISSRVEDGVAYVTVSGYSDAPRWHGHLIAGWITEALVLTGAQGLDFELLAGPWDESGSDIELVVRWKSG